MTMQIVRKLYKQRKNVEHILYKWYLYHIEKKSLNISFLNYRKDFFIDENDWRNIVLDKKDKFISWCFDRVWKSVYNLSRNTHNFEVSFTRLEEVQIIKFLKKMWLFQDFDMNELLFSPIIQYVNHLNFLWLAYRLYECYVDDKELFSDVVRDYWLYLYQLYTLVCWLIENFEELSKKVNYDNEDYYHLHLFKLSKYYFEVCFWYAKENDLITQQEFDYFNEERNKLYFNKITNNKIQIYNKMIDTKDELRDNFYTYRRYGGEETRTYNFEWYYQKKDRKFQKEKHVFQNRITDYFKEWEETLDWDPEWDDKKMFYEYKWYTIFDYLWLSSDCIKNIFWVDFICCLWTISDYKNCINELKNYEKIQNQSFFDVYWTVLKALENIQFKPRKYKVFLLITQWKNAFAQYFFQTFTFRADEILNNYNVYFKWEDMENRMFLWTEIFKFLWLVSHKYELYNQYLKLSLFYEFLKTIYSISQSNHSVSHIMNSFITYILQREIRDDNKMWSKEIYDKYKIRIEKLLTMLDDMSTNEVMIKIYWYEKTQDMTKFAKEYFQLYLEKILQIKDLFDVMNDNEKTNSTI